MKQYKNKNVLVTGGAGFIGSHLVDALIKAGAQVRVLDNLSTGTMRNLEHAKKKITFITGDIRNRQTCLEASTQCDYIFHLAACVSVPQSMDNPTFCHEANIDGTFNILEAAYRNHTKKVVFSSSCAVYGQQSEPCSESTACNPTSPYAYSKWIGELLCQQYARIYNVPTICLRYFNVFGERQNPYGPYAGVYAKFSDLMQQNKPVTIYGDGTQARDFISVHKVVEANLVLGALDSTHSNGQPVNIGTGETVSVLDVYKKLQSTYADYNYAPTFAPERAGDIVYSCAKTNLYEKLKTLY